MTEVVFAIIILIFSVVIHEVSHGYAANSLGDPTAKLSGRLTLNPLYHLDWFGSLILPLITYSLGGFILGWAKPVPYNPYNLKGKWGEAFVAGAGPLSNLILAIIFGMLIRFAPLWNLPESLVAISVKIVFINILLMVFNLIPVPPLDGSKILFALIPYRYGNVRIWLERYSLFLIIFVIFFLWRIISPIIFSIFGLITGL